MASATGIPERNQAHADTEPLLGRPGDVTQKDHQGLHWNLITGTATVAQAGTWILAALVWSAVFEIEITFFSYHPLLNSAGLLLFTQTILLLQPTTTPSQKRLGAITHSILNLLSLGLLIAGLVVIEMNKASHPETRFQSTHGKIMLAVYILLVLQVLIGLAQFYFPGLLGGVDNAKSVYKYHRMSGYVILLLSLVGVCYIVPTGFNRNALHIRLWPLVVASVLVVVGVAPRIKKAKLGL